MNSIERFLLALGGFTGFACAFFAALRSGAGVDGALMKASIAMLVAALLVKGFLLVTHSALREDAVGGNSRRQAEAVEDKKTASATAETR